MVVFVDVVLLCWFIDVFVECELCLFDVICDIFVYIDKDGYVVNCDVLNVVDLCEEVKGIVLLVFVVIGVKDMLMLFDQGCVLVVVIFGVLYVEFDVVYILNIECIGGFNCVLFDFLIV